MNTKDLSSTFGLDLNYFIKGGAWLTFSAVATALGGIILSTLFARLWPPDVFGQFSFLTAALGFMSLTVLPGMSQAITQASAENKDGTYPATIKILTRWSTLGTVLLIGGSLYFYFRENSNLAAATFVSALAFPISSIFSLYNAYLSGKKKFKNVAIFTVIAQFSSIGATALALLFFPSLFAVALLSFWSTAIVNAILTFVTLRKVENEKVDKKLLDFGKHLSFSQIFPIGAEYFDRFLIPILLGFSANAVYAFAIIIPMQIHNFLKIFINLAQPKITEIGDKNLQKDLIKKCLQLELLILGIVLAYIFFAPFIFDLLYPGYKKSALLISQIFSLSLLYFPSNLFGLALVKKRSAKSIYMSNSGYALISIFSLLVLVPTLGILGAVIAKIIARFSSAIMQIYLFKRLRVNN